MADMQSTRIEGSRDPRLAFAEALAAITLVMYIAYNLQGARDLALTGCFLVFLFGASHLDARRFRLVTLYTLAAYALVLDLLMYLRPESIPDPRLAWLSWLVLAAALPCFALIAFQVNAIRTRMQASHDRFRRLTEMSSDFYWESDADHRLTEGTMEPGIPRVPTFARGARPGERRWEVPSMSPDAAGWDAHRADLAARRPIRGFEMSRMGTDGSERHVSISGDPINDSPGVFAGYRGMGTDITLRKRAETALRDAAQEMRLLADNLPAMTASWDLEQRCRFANQSFVSFNGLDGKVIVGKRVDEILGEEFRRSIAQPIERALRGEPSTYRVMRVAPDGSERHVEVGLIPNVRPDGQLIGCFSVSTDITEHMHAQQRIERVAHHDELTGLPNRLLFRDRLGEAIAAARREGGQVALLYMDLDDFKPVNDTHGHAMGDDLLNAVAGRIREVVRESDTVARLGGDEFAVVLPAVPGPELARQIAAKIAAALAVPFQLGSPPLEVQIGTSIGVAMFPADGSEIEDLLRSADRAMYASKQGGSPLTFVA